MADADEYSVDELLAYVRWRVADALTRNLDDDEDTAGWADHAAALLHDQFMTRARLDGLIQWLGDQLLPNVGENRRVAQALAYFQGVRRRWTY